MSTRGGGEWYDCNAIGYKYIFGKSLYGSLMVCLLFVIIVQSPIHPIRPSLCNFQFNRRCVFVCRQLGEWQADIMSLPLYTLGIYRLNIISVPFTHVYTLRIHISTECLHSLTDLNNVKPNYAIGKIGPWCFCHPVRDKKERITNRSPPHPSGSLSFRLNVCIAHHTLAHQN